AGRPGEPMVQPVVEPLLPEPPLPEIVPPPIERPDLPRGQIQLSTVFIDPALLPTERLTECARSVLRERMPSQYDQQGYRPLREGPRARGGPAVARVPDPELSQPDRLLVLECRAARRARALREAPRGARRGRLGQRHALRRRVPADAARARRQARALRQLVHE